MPISPELVIFAIRATVRLGRSVQLELEAYIRNRDMTMPTLLRMEIDPVDRLRAEIQRQGLVDDEFKDIYARYLDSAVDERHQAEIKIHEFAIEKGLVAQTEQAQEERGLVTIRQWSEEADKGVPLARIGLAVVEVALDYVSTNPGVLGVGSNGERFVRAIAQAIDEILPDSGTPGRVIITPEQLFGERALAIFMHTGLSTLQAHIAETVEEEHLRDISISVLQPLVDNFRNGNIDRKTLNDMRDLLLGPMAQEAINAVVRHQRQFLGSRFAKDKGLGAVTEALLKTLAEEGDVRNAFEREVWLKVYGSILDVAIERPELFAGKDSDETPAFGRELLKTAATRLKDLTPPFNQSVAAAVTADAISVLSRHTVILFDQDDPWEKVAGKAVGNVLESISEGMKDGLQKEIRSDGTIIEGEAILRRVFSEDQVVALVHIITEQVAKTPGMVTGRETPDEIKGLVAGIARAISGGDRSLLSSEDWLEVAAIVAEEAAKNPGRLFRIVKDDGSVVPPEEEFAVRLIEKLLEAAAKDFRIRGRQKGSVLFGETLRVVIVETLKTASGNADAALNNQEALIEFVNRINGLQGTKATSFGRSEWLLIFRRYLKLVLLSEDGKDHVRNLSDDDLKKLILPVSS